MFLAGIAKRNAVLTRYQLALALEGILLCDGEDDEGHSSLDPNRRVDAPAAPAAGSDLRIRRRT
jgi:hypothetical protein